jgi:hypothetical protein
VEAEGFVFVTVIDEVTIEATEKDDVVLVTRDWDAAPRYKCKIGSKDFDPAKAAKKAPEISNKVDGEKSSKDDLDRFYNNRDIVVGTLAQESSTHMLVNFLTIVDKVGQINYNETTGLHYKFEGKWHISSVMKATFLLPNVATKWEMWDYSWEGGQLISAGASHHLHEVEVKHGLYIADESYFCDVGDLNIA